MADGRRSWCMTDHAGKITRKSVLWVKRDCQSYLQSVSMTGADLRPEHTVKSDRVSRPDQGATGEAPGCRMIDVQVYSARI